MKCKIGEIPILFKAPEGSVHGVDCVREWTACNDAATTASEQTVSRFRQYSLFMTDMQRVINNDCAPCSLSSRGLWMLVYWRASPINQHSQALTLTLMGHLHGFNGHTYAFLAMISENVSCEKGLYNFHHITNCRVPIRKSKDGARDHRQKGEEAESCCLKTEAILLSFTEVKRSVSMTYTVTSHWSCNGNLVQLLFTKVRKSTRNWA